MNEIKLVYSKGKRGICNICKQNSILSWDHIPPQRAFNIYAIYQSPLFYELITNRIPTLKRMLSQNGVKFRTICKRCNSELLGRQYDPVLIKFSKEIDRLINSKIYLPNVVQVKTKPRKLIKAIIGHVLAAKIEIDQVTFDEQLMGFFLDLDKASQIGINIFYWIFPYKEIVIMRDFVMPAVRGRFNKSGFFNLFKFYPLAFLLSEQREYEGLKNLSNYLTDENMEIEIPVLLNQYKPMRWPEVIDPGNYIMGGKTFVDSTLGIPKNK